MGFYASMLAKESNVMITQRFYFGALFVLVCMVGCGEKLPSDLPELYPVEIMVTQQDKPLADAYVQLINTESDQKYNSGGVTSEEGKTSIQTHGKYRGVPNGEYIVTVTKEIFIRKGPWDKMPADEFEARKFREENKSTLISKSFSVVASKYRDRKTTDLRVKVNGAPVTQTFELGAPVNEPIQ